MKFATIGDLQNSLPTVVRWIEEGESVVINKSGKPFALLAPITPELAASAQMPDFMSRLKEQFPDERPTPSILDYDRGNR